MSERTRRDLLLLVGSALAVMPALAGCGKAEQTPVVGESLGAAPEFATKSLEAEDVSLADYRGKVVLLNTWATWCDPCVHELPVLADLHRKLADKGFVVIGLNMDVRSKLPEVRAMVGRNDLPFPIWLDFENRAQVVFKLRGYPTSFLIDRQGNIRWKREGEIPKNDAELGAVLETVLAE